MKKEEGNRPLTGPQAVGRIRGSEANPRATQPMEVPIVALSLPLALTPPPGGRRGPTGEHGAPVRRIAVVTCPTPLLRRAPSGA